MEKVLIVDDEKDIADLISDVLTDEGFETVIKPEFVDPAVTDFCRSCKKCAEICPTGALKILE